MKLLNLPIILTVITFSQLHKSASSNIDIQVYEFTRNESFSFPGKQFVGHVFREFFTKRQVIHCAYECLRSSRCKSFNFNLETEATVCQLNEANHEEVDGSLEDEANGTKMEYHHRNAFYIDQEALGLCRSDPCHNNGRCLDTVNLKMEQIFYCICGDGWTGTSCDIQTPDQQQGPEVPGQPMIPLTTDEELERDLNRIDWGDWDEWGSCSVSCETGWTTRRRKCIDTVTKNNLPSAKCFGRDVEYKSCTLQLCPRWQPWGDWGACSTEHTCGRGVMHRLRNCSNGGSSGLDRFCLGSRDETAPCRSINCQGILLVQNSTVYGEGRLQIVNDVLDTDISICADEGWSNAAINIVCKQIGFEGASKDAENHTYNASSLQSNVPPMKIVCTGSEKNIHACRRDTAQQCDQLAGVKCRVRGGWSLWTSWGDCSVSCENGTRSRTRECNHPPPNFGGTPCPGENIQFKDCHLPMCPRNGTWGDWEGWSGCNVTCGDGTRIRYRSCVDMFTCYGSNVTYDNCTETPCDVDGVWRSWTPWSQCDVTCANGTRFRTRECIGPFYSGAECADADTETEECFPRMCEVDGIWNSWSAWTECSHTCGYGNKNRTRTCHGPFYGGNDCPGFPDELQVCNAFSCPVDGSWDLWTVWNECSVTCGGGIRNRTRDCNVPLHGGAGCDGPSEESEPCNDHNCPIDGVFAEWGLWSGCSVTCANGTRFRERICYGPYFGGANCSGSYNDEEVCVTAECPVDGVWDIWQPWQQCNVTCGGGSRLRVRNCIGPYYGGLNCDGSATNIENCNAQECPIDGYWDTWVAWNVCNVSCGGGYQSRMRLCVEPLYGGLNCTGNNTDHQECNTNRCPVDGNWEGWGAWSTCNVSCAGGASKRIRACNLPENGGENCTGAGEEIKQCNIQECPVDGVWESWANWTDCSVTCGSGTQTRNRTCFGPFYGGMNCPGQENENRGCNEFMCPIDGIYEEWTTWSDCSHTCGRGSSFRNRTCFGPYFNGAPCKGPDFETVYCNPSSCPVHGLWNIWAGWSECSTTCENGTRSRYRDCDGPYFGGNNCSGQWTEVEGCFRRWCPVDGIFTEWSVWNYCPVTCGGDIHTRSRDCIGPYHNGIDCIGELNQTKECSTMPCPVDGQWSLWSGWSDCNTTCGGGTSSRFRYCSETLHGGSNCTGHNNEFDECNMHECPVDGVWETWANWTDCSLTCGTGERQRIRNCMGPFYGGKECDGFSNELELCNTHECPNFLEWSSWKIWTACSRSCGASGEQLRVRTCIGKLEGSNECEGPQQEVRSCNLHVCPVDGIWKLWAEWSSCNVTCGGGTRWRNRLCAGPFYGGAECSGTNFNDEECNTHDCPIDGFWEEWSSWAACSVTCNGGTQSRYRDCIGPFHGGANCTEPYNETRLCNTFECPIDGVLTGWSEFYTCDVTCGGGIQWRNRTCIGPFYGGSDCFGPLEHSQECNMYSCPIDGVYTLWSVWDQCHVTCGGGIQWRNRTCDGPNFGGAECEGPNMENKTCNVFNCPVDGVWHSWSNWDECGVTCGGSMHSRYRVCLGPFYNGTDCNGQSEESRECNTLNCPVDGVFIEWSAWEDCDVSCGGGIQWRNRSCLGPFYGGADCEGSLNNSKECNTQQCPIDGVWLEWEAWKVCTVTCGNGTRLRERTCEGPFYGGKECSGLANHTETCGTDLCPIPGLWFEWSKWSLCSATCDGGTRHRNRTCDLESFGDLTTDCEGAAEETVDCHTFTCQPYAIHCTDWASRGLNQSCIADVDPDGTDTLFDTVQVECDFDTEPGKAVTILHHDQENVTRVKGFEGAGEYQVVLNYDVGWPEAINIIDSSFECAQFMRWDCLAAIIHNPFNPDMLTTFWMNRTEQMTNYFGGASPGSGNCACGETNSCFNNSLPCNCDENDDVWRYDEGFVTNKAELPIHSFYAGDTGGTKEDGFKYVGPVLCSGSA